MTAAAVLLFVGAALLLANNGNADRRRVGMVGRLTASAGAGMFGGVVTAVVVLVLDARSIEQEDRDHGRESVVDIGVGTYVLGAAVLLAVFGAIRGVKPTGARWPGSAVPSAEPGQPLTDGRATRRPRRCRHGGPAHRPR